jgi:ribosome-binding protein aMBF1 (putative translation factor)
MVIHLRKPHLPSPWHSRIPLFGGRIPKQVLPQTRTVTKYPAGTKPPHWENLSLPRKPNFARIVRDARVSRGLSVADLAKRAGVTGPCIYFWETGKTRPLDANLSALCKVLKLPVRATKAMAVG